MYCSSPLHFYHHYILVKSLISSPSVKANLISGIFIQIYSLLWPLSGLSTYKLKYANLLLNITQWRIKSQHGRAYMTFHMMASVWLTSHITRGCGSPSHYTLTWRTFYRTRDSLQLSKARCTQASVFFMDSVPFIECLIAYIFPSNSWLKCSLLKLSLPWPFHET